MVRPDSFDLLGKQARNLACSLYIGEMRSQKFMRYRNYMWKEIFVRLDKRIKTNMHNERYIASF